MSSRFRRSGGSGMVKVYSSGSALQGAPPMYLDSPAAHERMTNFGLVASFNPFGGSSGVNVATVSVPSSDTLPPTTRSWRERSNSSRMARRTTSSFPSCAHRRRAGAEAPNERVAAAALRVPGVVETHNISVLEQGSGGRAITLHVRLLSGRDPHHIVEAQFKAVGRALRAAATIDPREGGVPSLKGSL